MNKFKALIIGIISTINCFSQDEIQIRILPSKVASYYEMIIPDGERFIYEKYMNFKFVYFLQQQDTLVLTKDSVLVGQKVTVDIKNKYKSVDYCDTTINFIRNSSLLNRNYNALDDTCRKHIGLDNKEFNDYRQNDIISDSIQYKVCFNEFQKIVDKRFSMQLSKIKEIECKKKERMEWIRNNPDSVDLDYVRQFISDFNYCNIDKESFIELLIANSELVIKVCEELERLDEFYPIKWRMKNLPKNDRLEIAKMKIKKADYKGKIARQIKRKLNKNEG